MIQIAIVNASTILKDGEIQPVVAALQRQIVEQFEPIWGIDALLTFVPKGKPVPKGSWWIAILNNSDVAGALGYHDLTSEGLPLGKVFAATDRAYGLSWSVTLSHELLEMLVDPGINLSAEVDKSATSERWYAYEVCDPVESDDLASTISGVKVSNFVTPAWFEAMPHPAGTKFDFGGVLTKPFQLAPGGYMSVLNTTTRKGWVQLYGEVTQAASHQYRARPKVGSRRERRNLSREEWIHSHPRA